MGEYLAGEVGHAFIVDDRGEMLSPAVPSAEHAEAPYWIRHPVNHLGRYHDLSCP